MKPVQLVLTIAFVLFALCVAAWLVRPQPTNPNAAAAGSSHSPSDDILPIPKEGPYGKAVAKETTFEFGSVEVGSEGSHVFLIKNEGQGPLRVKGGGTSCPQCTIGRVSREDDIPPGETVEVEIKWKIKNPAPRFRQTADVLTTDPDNKKIVFGIQGIVEAPVQLQPEAWNAGDLSETEPTIVEGMLFSNVVDSIEMDHAECSNSLINVTWEPVAPEILAAKKAKSGLRIKVSIAPGTTVGPLRETVKLHTKVRDGIVKEFPLSGRRPGPLDIIGKGWNTTNNVAILGEFPASEGTKAKLKMYVRQMDEKLEAKQADTEQGGHSRVTIVPTGESAGESKIYDVLIEVPPGAPAVRHGKESEPIVLKLNHPIIEEFKMYLDYHAK